MKKISQNFLLFIEESLWDLFFQQGEPFTDIFLRAETAEARDGAVFHGNRSMRMSHLPVSALPRGEIGRAHV